MSDDELTPERAARDWNHDLQRRWQIAWAEAEQGQPSSLRKYDTMHDALAHAPPAPDDLLPTETIVRIWGTGYIIMDAAAWLKLPARARKKIDKLCGG